MTAFRMTRTDRDRPVPPLCHDDTMVIGTKSDGEAALSRIPMRSTDAAGPCPCNSGRMDLESVRAAEESLLSSAVRRDPSRVRELLHPDFVEIGRSGRRWSRDEIVATLSGEGERAATNTGEWHLSELGPDIALVTYIVRGVDCDSRHSSIWSSSDGRLRMLFHQGTFVASQ